MLWNTFTRASQVRDYSTWVEHGSKKRCIEKHRKDSFTLLPSPLPCGERHLTYGRRKWSKDLTSQRTLPSAHHNIRPVPMTPGSWWACTKPGYQSTQHQAGSYEPRLLVGSWPALAPGWLHGSSTKMASTDLYSRWAFMEPGFWPAPMQGWYHWPQAPGRLLTHGSTRQPRGLRL